MLRASYALVQATVGVGTVIIAYIGVAYTRGGGYFIRLEIRPGAQIGVQGDESLKFWFNCICYSVYDMIPPPKKQVVRIERGKQGTNLLLSLLSPPHPLCLSMCWFVPCFVHHGQSRMVGVVCTPCVQATPVSEQH